MIRWAVVAFALALALIALRTDARAWLLDPKGFAMEAPARAPEIALRAEPIGPGAVAVVLDVENFAFAMRDPGGTVAFGHAHLYVDGEKAGMTHEPYALLTGLQPGTRVLRATLNCPPDHRFWARNGEPIDAAITIEVE